MSKSRILAVLAACVVFSGLAAYRTTAQAPARPAAASRSAVPVVALLDISYIFKNHQRFKANMQDMQKDVQRAEESVKQQRDDIRKLAEQIQRFKGTRDQKTMEEELVKRQADLQATVALQKREFLQREARIYHDVYQEVLAVVDAYARAYNVSTVLRFNGDPVDVDNPEDVLRFINRPVVWYQDQQDITPEILKQLNRPQLNPTSPNRVGSRPGVYAPR